VSSITGDGATSAGCVTAGASEGSEGGWQNPVVTEPLRTLMAITPVNNIWRVNVIFMTLPFITEFAVIGVFFDK
jgi:hypothetical protein